LDGHIDVFQSAGLREKVLVELVTRAGTIRDENIEGAVMLKSENRYTRRSTGGIRRGKQVIKV